MTAKKDRTAQMTLAVTVIIFISKALGLVRDQISGYYFGASAAADAYISAYGLFYLPVLLFNSCITSTLIPMYVEAEEQGGLRRANRFASNSLNMFALLALAAGGLMMLLAAPLVQLVYPGFDAQKAELTVRLTRIMMPSLVFVVISIVLSSLLNATEHFMAAQLTGFPLSVAMIGSMALLSGSMGIDSKAWGVFAAGILQVLILLPAARKSFTYRPCLDIKDKRFLRLLALAVPSMLSMAVNELNHLIDRALASGLSTGDIACMDYAYKLITFIQGLLAVPVITIMFSRMSRRAAGHDRQGIAEIVIRCIETLTMILLPIIAIGSVVAPDGIRFVYQFGQFDDQAVQVTSGVFVFYLIGVLGFSLRDLLNRAFHAMQETRIPLYMSCVSVVLNIVLNVILSRVMGVNGLALATSISCAVGAALLLLLLRRRLGRMGASGMMIELLKIGVATALSLLTAMMLNHVLPQALGKAALAGRLAVCAGGALMVYMGAAFALRVRQLRFIRGMLKR